MNTSMRFSSSHPSLSSIIHNNDVLRQVIEFCVTEKDYIAVCVLNSGAFGESWQEHLVQLRNGGFLYQFVDSANQSSSFRSIQLDIDLARELNDLRSEGFKLRSMLNKNPDLKTGKEYGRVGTIFLAVGNEGEWVQFPRQITGGHYENNTINRLCQAFDIASSDSGKCSFMLVEQEEAKRILSPGDDPMGLYLMRQGMELYDIVMNIHRQPIRAYVTEELAHDAHEMGIELEPYQEVVIPIVTYKEEGPIGLIEFFIEWSEGKKGIKVSPTYLVIDESEPLFSEIKAYQDNLWDLKWISTIKSRANK